jgi:integrator complex subunit 2
MFLFKANPYSVIKTIKDRQELKNSLIAAQDTGVIQILLDLYLLIEKKSNELVTRDIQCIICSFIHQMFIENSNLAELVHFQGYPKQLIPILVRGVPSMHICIDFVPKLLSHSDLNKQIFAINLISALCQKYPIVRTYNVAKLAINSISTLLQGKKN